MKIYLVFYYPVFGSGEVEQVFANEEDAETYVRENSNFYAGEYFIEEKEVIGEIKK